MPANSILPPFPSFFGADGKPLEGGYIYIGEPGFEARGTPKAAWLDAAMTIPAGPFVRTQAGFPVANGTATNIYADGDFSITVTDKNGALVYTALNRSLQVATSSAAQGPLLAIDGTLAATGFGYLNEQNTGRIRSGTGVEQDVVQGVPVSQRTATGTTFLQPVDGPGVQQLAQPPDPVINGAFDIWQRGTSSTALGVVAADRWRNDFSGGTVTQSRQSHALGDVFAGNNPTYFLRQSVTGQSLASHYAFTSQRIEGVRTFAGQTVTFLFWAKQASGAGNIAVEAVQSFGTGGSPSADVTGIGAQIVVITGAWAAYAVTMTIPPISGKTLGTNGDDYFQINFWTSAGSNFNARTASLGIQTVGVDYWGIQSRIGAFTAANASYYRAPLFADTLRRCQRYYQVGKVYGWAYATGAGNFRIASVNFQTTMRSNIGIVFANATGTNVSGQTAQSINPAGFGVFSTAAGVGAMSYDADFTATAEL